MFPRSNVSVALRQSMLVLALMCASFIAPSFAAEIPAAAAGQPSASCAAAVPALESAAWDQNGSADEFGAGDWTRKPPRHGFCRCGCGIGCQTSADCGGASCDPFVTCCTQPDAAGAVDATGLDAGAPISQETQQLATVTGPRARAPQNLMPEIDGAQLGGACGCAKGLRCCLDCNGHPLCVRSIAQCPECPAP